MKLKTSRHLGIKQKITDDISIPIKDVSGTRLEYT